MSLWACDKADPESKGCVGNRAGFVKSPSFGARRFSSVDDVLCTPPAWAERENRRIRQGAYLVPQAVFEEAGKPALRPLLPSLYEASPVPLVPVAVNTHRVAISNSRIRSLEGGMVTFDYSDAKDVRVRHCRLDACEFIRRLMMHVFDSVEIDRLTCRISTPR